MIAIPLYAVLALAAGGHSELQPALDEIVLKDGKHLQGRVIALYEPEAIVVLDGGSTREVPRKELASVVTVRDRLRTFLAERRAPMHPIAEWKLVLRAVELGLPNMARAQAWHVLTVDPANEDAHRFLGHERKGKGWGWVQDGRAYSREAFEKRIADWDHRFALEGENWVLETDAGVARAVELLMDLERFYVLWLDRFGAELRAREFVRDPDRKMTYWLVTRADEPGVNWISTLPGEPYYSAGESVATPEGDPNLAIAVDGGAGEYPWRFFDVATQQLMYSLLVLGDVKGGLPPDDLSRHAHWVELGMGYWFGRQFGGSPGYGRPIPFAPDPDTKRDALLPGRGPLRLGRSELTNLVGLELSWFYLDADSFAIDRAKAATFFQFLMEQDPPLPDPDHPQLHGRDALMCYLREVYRTPTAHSSSKLDDCLGRRVEDLQGPWTDWLTR